VQLANDQGFENLYIDGGETIQRFLREEDLIDELIITEIPLLLGGGDRLFGDLDQRLARRYRSHAESACEKALSKKEQLTAS